VVQAALGLLNVLLAFLLARRWFGERAGLIAAAGLAVLGTFIYYEGELLDPVLLNTLCLLMLYALGRLAEKPALPRGAWAGLLLGLIAVVRPNILLFGVVALAWLVWACRRQPVRGVAAAAAGLVLGVVAAVAPVALRNYRVAGDRVLVSANAGFNLLVGWHAEADGTFVPPRELGDLVTSYDVPRFVEALSRRAGRPLKYSEVSALLARRAWDSIRQDPARAARLLVRKGLLFWGPMDVAHGKSEFFERRQSPLLRRLPGSFALVLALGLFGLAVLFAARRGPAAAGEAARARGVAVLLLLFVLAFFLSVLPFFIAAQYRVIVVPALLILGAVGLDHLLGLLRGRRFVDAVGWAAAGLLVYAAVSVNWAGYRPNPALWRYDRAVAFSVAGRDDLALAEYAQALRLASVFPLAHNNVAVILMKQSRPADAAAHLREAVRQAPDYLVARFNLGNALSALGQPEAAAEEYRAALRLHPAYAAAHYRLALALEQLGQRAEALTHLEEAARLRPDAAEVRRAMDALRRGAPPVSSVVQ